MSHQKNPMVHHQGKMSVKVYVMKHYVYNDLQIPI